MKKINSLMNGNNNCNKPITYYNIKFRTKFLFEYKTPKITLNKIIITLSS